MLVSVRQSAWINFGRSILNFLFGLCNDLGAPRAVALGVDGKVAGEFTQAGLMLGNACVGFGQLTLQTQFALRFPEPEREAEHQQAREQNQPNRNNGVLRHPCEKAADKSEDVARGAYRIFRRGGANFRGGVSALKGGA